MTRTVPKLSNIDQIKAYRTMHPGSSLVVAKDAVMKDGWTVEQQQETNMMNMIMYGNQPTSSLQVNLEELQAISDALHGRTQIRFDPDAPWTANKKLGLLTVIDAELALMKAEAITYEIPIEKSPQK